MCMLCNARKAAEPFLAAQFSQERGGDRFRRDRHQPVAPRPAAATDDDDPPRDSGRPGRRYLIRGGSIMSMDPRSATSSAATC